MTIVAAGNTWRLDSLDKGTPQSLGTLDNGLITVGGVTNDGSYWPSTTRQLGLGGSITVYAQAEDVAFALASSDNGYDVEQGTSLAAPAAVSGPLPAPFFY